MMYTTSRKTGIFIIALAIIILAAVIYFIFIYDFDKAAGPPTVTETGEQIVIPAGQPAEAVLEPVNFTTEDLVQTPVQLATSFIERFGTYSNQAPSNLSELNLFMTPAMAEWAAQNRQVGEDYENYYGITTIAVSQEAQEETAETAKILVHTTRTETKLDQARTFDQDAIVELVKQGKRWKVNAVRWQ